MISLCGLVPYALNTAPSQRYRIEQWLPALADRGISLDLVPFADSQLMTLLHAHGRRITKAALGVEALLRRIRVVASSRDYDAVVIHRAVCLAGPAVLERAIAILGKPVIFDFDDAIYLLHTTAANARLGWMKFPGKTAAICRVSNQVVVGNSFLAAYARRYNSSVTVVPTSVDTSRYRPREPRVRNSRVVVGWMGSSTSQTHLEMFQPVLKEIVRHNPVELRVVSDRRPDIAGVDVTWRPWSAETEAEELAGFDIGIMPMPDDQWSRGKCSLKALLYMATGAPAVCSAIGANREIIRHGENGLLASSPEEWVAGIGELARDPNLRLALGAAGRKTVEDHYSMDKCSALFESVVRRAVEQ